MYKSHNVRGHRFKEEILKIVVYSDESKKVRLKVCKPRFEDAQYISAPVIFERYIKSRLLKDPSPFPLYTETVFVQRHMATYELAATKQLTT